MSIEKNQKVVMNYELKINDEILESNLEKDPIEFTYGTGQIIQGLEEGIQDMKEGDTKVVKVSSDKAYGQYDESLSQVAPIEDFEGIDLQIGLVLEAENEKKEILRATVTDVTKEEVTVDYNHPLAGCDLEFKVFMKSIS
ncbi:MAG: peptidylprolyl isomerase [Poseidonibacter sp.]|uniref:FKBP-type peptidyl-prolyl cis-trans isomerase n=1 Tax=Poseidonibacter sp. TaxID=2321188 RepID=UPI00359E0436